MKNEEMNLTMTQSVGSELKNSGTGERVGVPVRTESRTQGRHAEKVNHLLRERGAFPRASGVWSFPKSHPVDVYALWQQPAVQTTFSGWELAAAMFLGRIA